MRTARDRRPRSDRAPAGPGRMGSRVEAWHDLEVATGRYAPSPTGTLHMGNLRTALAAWLFARGTDSAFLLRWDDLDATASNEHEVGQRRDLSRLGIDFDGPEMRQSERREVYADVLQDLTAAGMTYPCWCSRREVRKAAAAPHGEPAVYPGTCRDLSSTALAERRTSGRSPAIRIRAESTTVTIGDRLSGTSSRVIDDFVIARGDGTAAYHLTTVLDDAAQGVEEVVRGDDLLSATHLQAHLQDVLGLPRPSWSHVPLVLDEAGRRLAKRDGSTGIDRWLADGGSIAGLRAGLGHTLGIEVGPTASMADLRAGFDPARIPRVPAVIGTNGPELSLQS